MLELWGMLSTPSLQSLPAPLWSGVVAPDRVPSMGQIELNCNYAKLNCLKFTVFIFNYVLTKKCVRIIKWIVWNKTVPTINCE